MILLLSLVGSAVGYAMFAVGGALWVLLLSRLIDGLTAGNQSVAAACIGDLSVLETRARNFSMFGVAWGLGIIFGPAIGATTAQLSLEAPAWLAMGLTVATAVMTYLYLPETLPPTAREHRPLRVRDIDPFGTIISLIKRPELGPILMVLAIFNFVFNGFNSTESLYMLQRFAVRPWQVGVMLAAAGAAMALVQAPMPRLIRRLGAPRLATWALAAVTACVVLCVMPKTYAVFAVLVALRTAAAGLVFPSLGAAMSVRVPPREQGIVMGVNTALGSAMTVLGPLAAGFVYDHVSPASPYLSGAVLLTGAALWMRAQSARARSAPLTAER